jgi:flagellar M-ring protein FliF
MRDRVTATARRVGRTFGSFTPGQKAVTILGVVILAVGGYFFSTWAAKPSYSPLFSNLSSTDASAIVDKLSTDGASYQLADGGTTIMVPQNQVYDLRLKMSGDGLPAQSDTGYSLLDKQGITTSEFMQNVDYQRALEGELSKTIKSINGVQAASVHLAIPQKDIFADDNQKPTASVLIAAQYGKTPTADQVTSIVHLVASSVVGLDPTRVTVADSTGAVLSSGDGSALSSSAGGGRDAQTTAFEQRMDNALQKMLSSVVGSGHVVVTTTADLNYDQTQTKTQTYVAPSPSTPPLSQSNNSETYSGAGNTTVGVLGATAAPVASGSGGNYSKTSNTQDNAVGMVTSMVNSAPGNVRHLSVAVLLDSNVSGSVNKTDIQGLVSSAVGLAPSRGDTIAISNMPFDQSAAKQAAASLTTADKATQTAQTFSMAKTGAAVLAILILVFFAWRASKKTERTQLTAAELARLDRLQAGKASVGSPISDTAGTTGTVEGKEAQTAIAGPVNEQAIPAQRAQHQDLTSLMQSSPDDVANVLRGWMAEAKA